MKRVRRNTSMTARYRSLVSMITDDMREGALSSDAYSYWMNRLEHADTAAEIEAVEDEYYGAPRRRNGSIPVGANVTEGKRHGVIVAHRPQGMVDVRFKGGLGIERRKASNLRVMRSNPAEPYNPAKEQFNAVVQGVYESLVTDFLGVRNFRWRGERADERALADGRMTRDDVDTLVSRAFAIATAQEQRSRRLKRGTNVPTVHGVQASAKRRQSKAHTAANQEDFERTLELRRKIKTNGVKRRIARKVAVKTAARAGGKAVPFVGEALMVMDAAPVVVEEGRTVLRRRGEAARTGYAQLRSRKYRDAARTAGKLAWTEISDAPRAVIRVAGTGILGREGYELAAKARKKGKKR